MDSKAEQKTDVRIDISIVLEWENVLLSEQDRCISMLQQLRSQLHELPRAAEVIVLFSPDQVRREDIEPILDQNLAPGHGDTTQYRVRLESVHGCHYYQLKNEGAKRAVGQVLVFIDSDVIPEPNWLEEISRFFFQRDDVDAVAGHTYLSYDSLGAKAFALAWTFPLRDPDDRLESRENHFFANSVAFRRDLFVQYPFPSMAPGMTRGACKELTRILTRSGYTVWTNTAARASHPPPSGLQHYLVRALAHGRDQYMRPATAGRSRLKSLKKSLRWSVKRTGKAMLRIVRLHKRVKLPWWQAPVAIGIMTFYYAVAFVGSCLSLAFPRYAATHWQI